MLWDGLKCQVKYLQQSGKAWLTLVDHGRAIAFCYSTKNLNAKAVEPGFQEMSVAEGDDTLGRSRRKKIEYLQQKVLHWWAMWEGHRFGSPNQPTNNNVNGSIYFRLLRPFVCFPCWTYNQSRCWLFVCKCSLYCPIRYTHYSIRILRSSVCTCTSTCTSFR